MSLAAAASRLSISTPMSPGPDVGVEADSAGVAGAASGAADCAGLGLGSASSPAVAAASRLSRSSLVTAAAGGADTGAGAVSGSAASACCMSLAAAASRLSISTSMPALGPGCGAATGCGTAAGCEAAVGCRAGSAVIMGPGPEACPAAASSRLSRSSLENVFCGAAGATSVIGLAAFSRSSISLVGLDCGAAPTDASSSSRSGALRFGLGSAAISVADAAAAGAAGADGALKSFSRASTA